MPENFKTKFALENLARCQARMNHLNDWEREFIKSLNPKKLESLTLSQFNKLHEIATSRKVD